MSLRSVLTFLLTVLGLLVLAAAGSLAVLTGYLQRASASIGTTIDGVRLAEELEVDLLTHYRRGLEIPPEDTPDTRAVQLGVLEERFHRGVREMARISSTSHERALLDSLRQQTASYFAAQREAARQPSTEVNGRVAVALDDALVSLEHLIELNVLEARAAESQAVGWARFAAAVGSTLGALLVLGMGGMLFWMRRAVLRPVTEVSQAMRRFGAGRKRTRAPETGPSELREMARTFNEMATSLARQQEDQLTFLAGVAHDLRNPLSALKMSTALGDSRRPEMSPERMQKTFALVRRQVARLDRMVGDLLDATRIEAGKLELRLEERDARELARGVVELYQASGQSHELCISLPEAPVPLYCDGTRLEQVLNNLVSNALKYSPTGTRVDVTVSLLEGEVLLSVTDRGIGLSVEELRHLFMPFKRSRGARESAPGAGLGLSVARRIVEAHGGRIEVDSRPGQGATFRVRLPLSRAATQPPARPAASPVKWNPGDAVH